MVLIREAALLYVIYYVFHKESWSMLWRVGKFLAIKPFVRPFQSLKPGFPSILTVSHLTGLPFPFLACI